MTSHFQTSPEWRRVEGWPYEVSEFGQVRRIGGNLVLRPWRLKNGRLQVRLMDKGQKWSVHTYRLVGLAFLGPQPFPGAELAHRDDNKDNNHVSNIKWCSHKENCADRLKNGKAAIGSRNGAHTHPHRRPRGERVGVSKLTDSAAAEIKASRLSSRILAHKYGVSKTTVKDCRKGKTWRHVEEIQNGAD